MWQNTQKEQCQGSFINEYLLPANCDIEIPERSLALKWIPKSATVLEVGARYGSVSCVISAILEHSGRLVSVEADETVWEVLERNRANLRCNFHIAKGLLAKQAGRIQKNAYGTIAQSGDAIEGDAGVVVPHFSIDELRQQYDTAFDVAVFDCEGCFSGVLKDFPELKQQLKLLIVESHGDDEHQMMMELVRDAGWQIHERSLNLWVLVNAGDVAMRKGPRTTKIRWTLQRKCPQDCTQVCRQEDMSCDDGAFQSLAGLLEAKLAFKAAGHQCHEFVEKQVQDPLWNGPGAIVDTCEYSSNPGPHGDSSCNIVSYCGWGQGKFRLCPCF